MTVLLYSDDVTTRDKVKLAVGRRPAPDLLDHPPRLLGIVADEHE